MKVRIYWDTLGFFCISKHWNIWRNIYPILVRFRKRDYFKTKITVKSENKYEDGDV